MSEPKLSLYPPALACGAVGFTAYCEGLISPGVIGCFEVGTTPFTLGVMR